jgi:hypothetical protein
MRKISMFAAATALILAGGIGAWAISTTQARVEAAAPAVSVDPLQVMMKNTKELPAEEFVDYSFVFN